MKLIAAGRTNVGRKRSHNEDNLLLAAEENLFVVADGVGGLAGARAASNTTVKEIQKALKANGYNPGPLDGIYGRQTSQAVTAFQKANNMASGQLTFETVEALGL